MKLSTSIFALVAASAVYANSTNSIVNFLKKREVTFDASQLQDISVECYNEFLEYAECENYPLPQTYDKVCPIVTGEKCQKYYNDPMSFLPSCKEFPAVVETTSVYKSLIPSLKFFCQKDEAGNHCPLSDEFLASNTDTYVPSTLEEMDKILEATCHSKICREVSYEFSNTAGEMINDIDNLSTYTVTGAENGLRGLAQMAKYLNSDECKAMSSGATSLKISSGLFISLGLLLLSLY